MKVNLAGEEQDWRKSSGSATEGGMTSIPELTQRICTFRDAREWGQFHDAKELTVALTAEVGELLQHFVWQRPEQLERRTQQHRAEIEDEVADVGILLFELAEYLGIDLGQAMLKKLERNEHRYPVEKARGSNAKYNEL